MEDDHFVNAGCGHFYHSFCLLQWAEVNSNCPQCRANFVENRRGIEEEGNEEGRLEAILEERVN